MIGASLHLTLQISSCRYYVVGADKVSVAENRKNEKSKHKI